VGRPSTIARLLKGEDGKPKKEGVVVEYPLLSIFATTVLERLPAQIKEEDWKSGMCQRFAFVIAQNDPSREWFQAQYWDLSAVDVKRIEEAWIKLYSVATHKEYRLPQSAIKQVARAFEFFGANTGLEEGFVRRIGFRIYKYALVFHWLLGKASNEIDAQDIGYGSRLAMLHLSDLKGLLSLTTYAEFMDLVRRAREVKKDMVLAGRPFDYRQVLMRLHRRVRNREEAQLLVDVVEGDVALDSTNPDFSSLLAIENNLGATTVIEPQRL
jgi:hypothetical protein